MKRLIVIFLTLVMCLAMSGCKSEEVKQFETLFKGIGEVSLEAEAAIVAAEAAYEALPDGEKASVQQKADMLAEMRREFDEVYRPIKLENLRETQDELDILKAVAAANNNQSAMDYYIGNAYIITGYVESVDTDRARIVPLMAPIHDLIDPEISVDVYLAPEELEIISEKDIINVAGQISDVNCSHDVSLENGEILDKGLDYLRFEMRDAVYIDDIVEFIGTASFSVNYSMGEHLCLTQVVESIHVNRFYYHSDEWDSWDEAEAKLLDAPRISGEVCGKTISEGDQVKVVAADVTLIETVKKKADKYGFNIEWSVNSAEVGVIKSVEILK